MPTLARSRWRELLAILAIQLFACSGSVTSGYPPLVTACKTAADCSAAGPQFVCSDGGCTVATCQCDQQCPAGLGCELLGGVDGECVNFSPIIPCPVDGGVDAGPDGGEGGPDAGDAGPADGGPQDSGPDDAGLSDGGPEDSGIEDSGPQDAGPEDAGPSDAGLEDAGQDGGLDDGGDDDGGNDDGGKKDGGKKDKDGGTDAG
jgi:hypothetical protein